MTLELVSALLGFIYIVFARFQRLEAWVFWLLSSVGYFFVFWQSELYAQMILQLFFIFTGIIGYLSWKGVMRFSNGNVPVVHSLSVQMHIKILVLCLPASLLGGYLLQAYSSAVSPYIDFAIALLSVVATLLCARKVLECWHYWIAINIFAAMLFFTQQLYTTTVLYLFYFLFSLYALRGWKRSQSFAREM